MINAKDRQELFAFIEHCNEEAGTEKAVLAFFRVNTLEKANELFKNSITIVKEVPFIVEAPGRVACLIERRIVAPQHHIVSETGYFFVQNTLSLSSSKAHRIWNCIEKPHILEEIQSLYDAYAIVSPRKHAELMIDWCKIGTIEETVGVLFSIIGAIEQTEITDFAYKGDQAIMFWLSGEYIKYWQSLKDKDTESMYFMSYGAFLKKNKNRFIEGLSWDDVEDVYTKAHHELAKNVQVVFETPVQAFPQSDR
jgi:hypothetical protein